MKSIRPIAMVLWLGLLAGHLGCGALFGPPVPKKDCSHCDGAGETECLGCQGTGQSRTFGAEHTNTCTTCRGTGHLECTLCRGTGKF